MKTTISQLITTALKYRTIRVKIRNATSTLNPVDIVTPVGISDIKEEWIKKVQNGVFTNPHFEYNQELLDNAIALRPELEKLRSELNSLPAPGDYASQFILEQIGIVLEDGIGTTYLAEAIKNGRDNDSADIIAQKYGLPSDESVSNAIEIVLNNDAKNKFEHDIKQNHPYPQTNLDVLNGKKLEAKEIKDIFEWTMKSYPMAESWPVVITDRCTSIDVRDKSSYGHPVIVIPENRKVTGMELAKLAGHEIECHWRCSVNAGLIGCLKADDELLYEGLAAVKDKNFSRRYLEKFEINSVYYILAMHEAMSGYSFEKVAKIIYDYLPECLGDKKAAITWRYTYRVFRGITNPENPDGYAFTKDRAYYEGWRYARDLIDEGKEAYLNFSTLGRKSIERLMDLIDVEDIEAHVVNDRNLQEKSLEKILRCLNYNGSN